MNRCHSHDKLLFTPGPLTTSSTVKQAMLQDLGSRDTGFIQCVQDIRNDLLKVAGTRQSQNYECVIIQGSGTFAVEAVIGSALPPEGKLLILINGAYGARIAQISSILGISYYLLESAENVLPDLTILKDTLAENTDITHVAAVHCETTTGLLNPIAEIGRIVNEAGCTFIVDAMSSFGGIPIDMNEIPADFLISSANKCIEGVPGFAFVLARHESLQKARYARSLSLDLHAQWHGLEENGQFRFTPPTHALLAFRQALSELQDEGGVPARHQRYEANHSELIAGMTALGFSCYLPAHLRSPIITSFHYPDHPCFDFTAFYNRLNELGHVIYPGKVSSADCFRIGTIGRIFVADVLALIAAIKQAGCDCGFMGDDGIIIQEVN